MDAEGKNKMGKQQFNDDFIDTNEALKIVADIGPTPISLPTLIDWAETYKIGKKIGGRWWINKQELTDMLIRGNPNGT